MLTKAHPERFFIGSIMLAFAALIMATVGIKPQLLQNLQFLILLVSLLLVIWIGFNAGKFEIITNRLRMQAMGWLIAATCSAALWSFAQKSTQLIFPALKEFRKIWNTFEPFALFATVVCVLFALILFIVGSRDSKLERPGYIESSLVNNLSSKIAALPMVFTAIGVFVIATLWTFIILSQTAVCFQKVSLLGSLSTNVFGVLIVGTCLLRILQFMGYAR